jgi:hypothetical protein
MSTLNLERAHYLAEARSNVKLARRGSSQKTKSVYGLIAAARISTAGR